MRTLALIVLIACGSSGNKLPAETWGSEDYLKAGVPASDHVWSIDEHETAVSALRTLSAGHRERLPRLGGPRSGAVFARVIERVDITDVLPDPRTSFLFHMRRFEAANTISKLYILDALATTPPEYRALIHLILLEAVDLDRIATPFIDSFGPDDPKREARLSGLRQMEQGYGEMLHGSVLTLADRRLPEPERIAFAKQVAPAMKALLGRLEPDTQTKINAQVEALSPNVRSALRP